MSTIALSSTDGCSFNKPCLCLTVSSPSLRITLKLRTTVPMTILSSGTVRVGLDKGRSGSRRIRRQPLGWNIKENPGHSYKPSRRNNQPCEFDDHMDRYSRRRCCPDLLAISCPIGGLGHNVASRSAQIRQRAGDLGRCGALVWVAAASCPGQWSGPDQGGSPTGGNPCSARHLDFGQSGRIADGLV